MLSSPFQWLRKGKGGLQKLKLKRYYRFSAGARVMLKAIRTLSVLGFILANTFASGVDERPSIGCRCDGSPVVLKSLIVMTRLLCVTSINSMC
jgi:hypothetical protein